METVTTCAWCGRKGSRDFVRLNLGLVAWVADYEARHPGQRVLVTKRAPIKVCTATASCAKRRKRRVVNGRVVR